MTQFNFAAQRPIEKYHRIDVGFLIAVFLMWGIGLFTMFVCSQDYAARFFKGDSYHFIKNQLICSAVGFVLFFSFLFIDMEVIKKLVFWILIATIILCALTYVPAFSVSKNGARRWLKMPGKFTFQPSELVKFTVILYLALYFEKQEEKENEEDKSVLTCVFVFLSLIVMVLCQKDFSTSMFIALVGVLLFFVSGAKLRSLIPVLIIAIPLIFLIVTSKQYRLERVIGWINPTECGDSYNLQVNRAKNAITAGGIWGRGIGVGVSRLNKIPEVQADYIFAGLSETMGFFGVVLYLLLLGFFAWRGFITAFKCPSRFAGYASFGCILCIVLQSLVNVMVVCGLLPSTGIPLPFFSVGGSSIIVTLGMCGFVLNASRCETKEDILVEPSREITLDDLTVL